MWAYRCGFFTLDTVNYMIREHEGETNGVGTRTPLSRGARLHAPEYRATSELHLPCMRGSATWLSDWRVGRWQA